MMIITHGRPDEAQPLYPIESPRGLAALDEALETQRGAPRFRRREAEAICASAYGVDGVATTLRSERDQNFLISVPGSHQHVLKISNAAERLDVLDFQDRLLDTVATNDPALPIPRVIATLSGRTIAFLERDGVLHAARLLSFVPGSRADVPLERSRRYRHNVGRAAARLSRAMRGLRHDAADRPLIWDVKRAHLLRPLSALIPDAGVRQEVDTALDWFEHLALPRLTVLPTQVIHGDLSPSNLLVDPQAHHRIAGIIDFGDAVEAPRVIDLAVAASFQALGQRRPRLAVDDVVDGYGSTESLLAREALLVPGLAATRIAMRIAIDGWRTAMATTGAERDVQARRSARLATLRLLRAGGSYVA
jgi:Ser/Thr protein kinase RdoA (MazF antagonist)